MASDPKSRKMTIESLEAKPTSVPFTSLYKATKNGEVKVFQQKNSIELNANYLFKLNLGDSTYLTGKKEVENGKETNYVYLDDSVLNDENTRTAFNNSSAVQKIELEDGSVSYKIKADSITLTDAGAKDRAFQITVGEESEKITISAGARGFVITKDGQLLMRKAPDNENTFNFALAEEFVANLIAGKAVGATFQTAGGDTSLKDYSPEFMLALARIPSLKSSGLAAPFSTHTIGNFEFFNAESVKGTGLDGNTVDNRIVFIRDKEAKTLYTLSGGTFKPVQKANFTYMNKAGGEQNVALSLRVGSSNPTAVRVPITLPTKTVENKQVYTQGPNFQVFSGLAKFLNGEEAEINNKFTVEADGAMDKINMNGITLNPHEYSAHADIKTGDIKQTISSLDEEQAQAGIAGLNENAAQVSTEIIGDEKTDESAPGAQGLTEADLDRIADEVASRMQSNATEAAAQTEAQSQQAQAAQFAEAQAAETQAADTNVVNDTAQPDATNNTATDATGGSNNQAAERTLKFKGLADITKVLSPFVFITGAAIFIGGIIIPVLAATLIPAGVGLMIAGSATYIAGRAAENFELKLKNKVKAQEAAKTDRQRKLKRYLKREKTIESINSKQNASKREQNKLSRLKNANWEDLASGDIRLAREIIKAKFENASAEERKAFIEENAGAIALTVMANANKRSSKQFLAKNFLSTLSEDERELIDDAANKIASYEDKKIEKSELAEAEKLIGKGGVQYLENRERAKVLSEKDALDAKLTDVENRLTYSTLSEEEKAELKAQQQELKAQIKPLDERLKDLTPRPVSFSRASVLKNRKENAEKTSELIEAVNNNPQAARQTQTASAENGPVVEEYTPEVSEVFEDFGKIVVPKMTSDERDFQVEDYVPSEENSTETADEAEEKKEKEEEKTEEKEEAHEEEKTEEKEEAHEEEKSEENSKDSSSSEDGPELGL